MRAAILDLLSGDSTLMATLTGGLYDAGSVGQISRQGTAAAFDANEEILPCGLLKFSSQGEFGPYEHSSRLFFSVMLYERVGYGSIETARARVYALLHRERVTPVSGGCWEIRHADDVLDVQDEALGCSLAVSRFWAVVNRG